MKKNYGVLLVNLGTPDEPTRSSVYTYLKQFLLDPRVIDINPVSRNLLVRGLILPFRSGASAKLYRELWTSEGSPIKYYGFKLRDLVQSALGDDYYVEIGMRYQNPSIDSALEKLLAKNPDKLIVLPLFPQYASASTGSVMEEVMRLLGKRLSIPPVSIINSFHDNREMLEVFAANARKFDIPSYDHIIFSFHGVPQRQMIKSDRFDHCLQSPDCCSTICVKNKFCYSAQCHDTAHKLANMLNLAPTDYTISYQSRLGKEPWMQPYSDEVIEERAKMGDKRLLVFSPAFVADCLETTIEIGVEYLEDFKKWGGDHLDLVPSLNDDPNWVAAVANMIRGEV